MLLGLIIFGCGASPTPAGPPPSAIRTYIEAGILVEQGDLTAAAARYDDATAIDPTSFEVWLGAAHARIQLGEWDAARKRAEHAWKLVPNHPRVATTLGQILLGKGSLEAAARMFAAAVEAKSDYTQAWKGLAEVQLRQGQIDAAVSSLEHIAALHPETPKTWLQIAQIQEKRRKPLAAARAYQQVVKLEPVRRHLNPRIMALALEGGDLDLARDAAQRMSGGDAAAASFALATILLKRDDLLGASNELERLLARYPDHHQARLKQARIMALVKRNDEARAHLDLIPPAARAYPAALRLQGLIALSEGHPKAAIIYLERARKYKPERLDLWESLARARLAAGQNKAAQETISQAIKQWPDSVELQYAHGLILQEIGSEAEAMAVMQAIIKQDRSHAQALNFVGYTWAENGERLDEAVALIQRALVIKPNEPAFIDSLGWALYRQGHMLDAERALWRASKMVPNQMSVVLHLLEVLWVSDQRDMAKAQVKRVLKSLDPKQRKMFGRKWRRIKKEHR